MERSLVLVRHGQSEWNLKNLFTGWKDPDLTEKGCAEAVHAGEILREAGLVFDVAYTSALKRAQKTLELIQSELEQSTLPVIRSSALNERDYGDLTGINKEEACRRWGAEQVRIWRRSFDTAPPGGESLKMTADRVLPYYHEEILPKILEGQHVLIVAHGNSLRALIMELESLSAEQILQKELATGHPILYRLSRTGLLVSREDLFKPY